MYCGSVKRSEGVINFYYPHGSEVPKPAYCPLIGSTSYKLVQVTYDWFCKEEEALKGLSHEKVVDAQVRFVQAFCQIKSIPVDFAECKKKIVKANALDELSPLLEAVLKIRVVVAEHMRLNPFCFLERSFRSLCSEETRVIEQNLRAERSPRRRFSSRIEFLPSRPVAGVSEESGTALTAFQGYRTRFWDRLSLLTLVSH